MKLFCTTVLLLFAPLLRMGQASLFPATPREGPLRVALVPLGHVPAADLSVVQRALGEYYRVQLTVMAPLTVPGDARVTGSTQSVRVQAGQLQVVADTGVLQADRLLSLLAGYRQKGFDKVVGVTPCGIRTGRAQWTIRGNALDASGVVSTYLVRQQSTKEEFAFRLAKVARHEFGHMLGLPHCGNQPVGGIPVLPYAAGADTLGKGSPHCFMRRSNAEGAQFYATTNQLCSPCAGQVRNHLRYRLSP